MKKFFKARVLNKLILNQTPLRYKGLEKAKLALVIFRNTIAEKHNLALKVEEMLAKYGIQIDYIGFVPIKLEKGTESVQGFYFKNDLDWKDFPKGGLVQKVINTSFDIIIDLDDEMDSPNTFILLSAKAGIRVGLNRQKDVYDLSVEKAFNDDESIVTNIEYYLKNTIKV